MSTCGLHDNRAMTTLVTGSSGHLGEALMRTFRGRDEKARGIDIKASAFTDATGDIADAGFIAEQMRGVDVVMHTATLHKPHVVTHSKQDFIDTNVSGTRVLLEAAIAAGVKAFICTSTTSTFGRAMQPAPGAPAVWVTEALAPVPKNIYGVTKVAAEGLCELAHLEQGMPCIVLRTSRFFPEEDDSRAVRDGFSDVNAKVNEYTHRRVELADVVSAHECAAQRAAKLGFGRYIVTATTPFTREDAALLGTDAAAVMARRVPGYAARYEAPRLAATRQHRPRLRQRGRASRPRLGTGVRRRAGAGASRGGQVCRQ